MSDTKYLMENSQGILDYNENYKKNEIILNISETQKCWVAGFIEGEGSTNISFKKQKNMKIGLRPCPSFSVTQHYTGVKSLEIVQTTLGGIGRIYPKPGKTQVMVYEVTKLSHLQTVIIPFLEKYNYLSARKTELLTF
uniref:Putative LAGLIDADG homing endonuclease n=1 Tax=Stigeoclonium helveticum TaxID=55999 RepID=A0A6M4SRR9_STIHE|nr:putative LAGLIDADG homing endonuclease [Stigeoclonium helveticum]